MDYLDHAIDLLKMAQTASEPQAEALVDQAHDSLAKITLGDALRVAVELFDLIDDARGPDVFALIAVCLQTVEES
jgi:hypothetical protein